MAGSYAFPSTVLDRTGYAERALPSDTCCQTRLVGWNAEGQLATLVAEHLPDRDVFRFAVDFHDLVTDEPRPLFERMYFRDDPAINGACARSRDLLRCLWTENAPEIRRELAKAGIREAGSRKLLPLPRHVLDWTHEAMRDQDQAGESAPFSLSDSAGILTFHMVDTAAGGLHLMPLGMISEASVRKRWLVMRLCRRELLDAPMSILGLRFLRLDRAP